MSNNDEFLALIAIVLKKLSKRDALPLIYLIVLATLLGDFIQASGNVSNKIPDPYDKMFLISALGIAFSVVVACCLIIKNLIFFKK